VYVKCLYYYVQHMYTSPLGIFSGDLSIVIQAVELPRLTPTDLKDQNIGSDAHKVLVLRRIKVAK
jgi:hypothetical protein